jgi:hypothetical protein
MYFIFAQHTGKKYFNLPQEPTKYYYGDSEDVFRFTHDSGNGYRLATAENYAYHLNVLGGIDASRF